MDKIADLAKELQTDPLKTELYKLTLQFVRKYWKMYYPKAKESPEDMAMDFYTEFLTPKSRVKGQEQSLLDKFNPDVTTLPYLVKVSVIRKLIDKSRSDKGEINYSENYDEEGNLSLDYLAGGEAARADNPDEFSDEEQREFVEKFRSLTPEAKAKAIYFFNRYKKRMSQKTVDIMNKLIAAEKVGDDANFDEIELRDLWEFDAWLQGKEDNPRLLGRFANELDYEDFMFANQDKFFALASEEELSGEAPALRPRSEMTPEEKQEFEEFLFSLPPVDAYNGQVVQWLEERGFDPEINDCLVADVFESTYPDSNISRKELMALAGKLSDSELSVGAKVRKLNRLVKLQSLT